jgi:two-component system, NtrC family, response regulator AtoC
MKTHNKKLRVLVADDDEKIVFAFKQLLIKEKVSGLYAEDGLSAYTIAMKEKPDLVFLDYTLPKINGLEVLRKLQSEEPSIPIVIITGHGSMHIAVQAIKDGAYDYFTKPLDIQVVRNILTKIREAAAGNSEDTSANRILYNSEVLESNEIIGKSALMQEVYKLIGSISRTPNTVPVLITGESGTGKELIARAIHNNCCGGQEPFIGINCNAIPEGLLESELFGHEKGSFTGAYEQKAGKFELAGGGTIFLDEIGDLSLNFQQKFLRVLQNRVYERIGGVKSKQVKARFIAATNIDIHEAVENKSFRKDLFYRLHVAHIHLPSLRERREDIPLLVEYMMRKYNYELKKRITSISPGTMERLMKYYYPGNVRELANIIERGFILAKGDRLEIESIDETTESGSYSTGKNLTKDPFSEAKAQYLAVFEEEYVKNQLLRTGGNVSNAAKLSGMTRQNFQRLIQKHKLEAKDFR